MMSKAMASDSSKDASFYRKQNTPSASTVYSKTFEREISWLQEKHLSLEEFRGLAVSAIII